MTDNSIKKIVLAYSGGLDTSIIIPWLKENYSGVEVIAVCVDVGQEEDLSGLEEKAKASGASKLYFCDVKEVFAKDYLFPLLRAGAKYEGKYLLGTSIARPLQAKCQIEVALKENADAVAHGCTGKGNDQVRFELTYKALAPNLKVIAPWRIWNISSREQAIEFAHKHNIPLGDISKKNIYSRDSNIWHLSHEGGDIEDTRNRPTSELFKRTISPKDAPDKETEIQIDFEKGFPVGINGTLLDPLKLLERLNNLGKENGIGRTDVVETRVVGMKSRGIYETPAGTILYKAIKELEMLTLDSECISLKQILAIKYAEVVYQGKWFTTLRESLDALMAKMTEYVTGSVKLALYKGNIIILSRVSPFSLYRKDIASFGESTYNQKDATGFINLYGLSTMVSSNVRKGKYD